MKPTPKLATLQTEKALKKLNIDTKNSHPIAKTMADMTTRMKITLKRTDNEIASIMTDGCNMGVKSLSGYLNQYKAASERSKDIAKKLIAMEADLGENMRNYL